MSVVELVVGAAMMLAGGMNVAFRETIVARHRARSPGQTVQSPYAYLVMGVLLMIGGTLMFAAGLIEVI